ncbi:hypothetical protein S245_044318, partial [Arachis hypogaea]
FRKSLDEMGHPSIPLSVISKAAELQFHYTVDKVILGNRWLRKQQAYNQNFPIWLTRLRE